MRHLRSRAQDGSIGSPVSLERTGSRLEVERWTIKEIAAGRLRPPVANVVRPTFAQYATEWWIWGKCPYMEGRRARGYSFSQGYAATRRAHLEHHVLPKFGPFYLDSISPLLIDRWVLDLRKGKLTASTINRILGTVKVMFAEAVRLGLLPANPATAVGELKEEPKEEPKERGILSLDELKALLRGDSLEAVWHGELRHYGCNLLLAAGGLHLGECQGLQIQDVGPTYVRIVHGWSDVYGMQAPKWNSVRLVPITSRVQDTLRKLTALGKWGATEPDDVLFWGQDRKTSLTKSAILKRLKSAVRAVGIPEPERKRRNLVFHPYRHGFSTLPRGKVADEQLRRVTGHKTLALTNTYDHAGAEHLRDGLEAQDKLFAV